MAQMTEKRYKELKAELVVVKEKHAEAVVEQEAAKEFGDLAENAEYDTAKRNTATYLQRKNELEEEIANAEIVEEDRSPRITVGSVIDVCKVDKEGKEIGPVRRFTIENRGDTILAGILGANSSLGKTILNSTSGIYQISDNGGLRYRVKKVLE